MSCIIRKKGTCILFALKYNSYLSLNLIASYISNCFLWRQGLKVHNLSKGNNTQETDIYFLMWIWELLKFLSYLNDELCSWERQIKSLENQEGLHIQYRQWAFKHKWHSEKISTWGAKWCLSRWYVLLSVKQKGTMAASPGLLFTGSLWLPDAHADDQFCIANMANFYMNMRQSISKYCWISYQLWCTAH